MKETKDKHAFEVEVHELDAFVAHGIYPRTGYVGAFSRDTAAGAIPSGQRIKKVWCESDDQHPVGSLGTVLGSIAPPGFQTIMYFIEWDAKPGFAVATIAKKIARA